MEIQYGATAQYITAPNTSPPLDNGGIKWVQGIMEALLYYAWAINNKLLVALSELGSQQATTTEATCMAIAQLLDSVATYPNDGIIYRASSMVLAAHSDAAYLNVSNACSHMVAHIMLSEDTPVPPFNGPILTIANIIKFVMSLQLRLNLRGSSSQPRKWFRSTKPSSKWVGHSHLPPYRWTTQLLLVSPTTPLSHDAQNPWTCNSTGSIAGNHSNSSVTTGHWGP